MVPQLKTSLSTKTMRKELQHQQCNHKAFTYLRIEEKRERCFPSNRSSSSHRGGAAKRAVNHSLKKEARQMVVILTALEKKRKRNRNSADFCCWSFSWVSSLHEPTPTSPESFFSFLFLSPCRWDKSISIWGFQKWNDSPRSSGSTESSQGSFSCKLYT